MAWTIYKPTDASAPTLSGTAGDAITVLSKCLVTGYGAKAAAGWSMAYPAVPTIPGETKAVFYAGAGSSARMYFRVLDDGSHVQGAMEAGIRGYEAMSDIDTGTGDFPTAVQKAKGIQIQKSNAASAATRPWIVAADDRTCILGVKATNSTHYYLHYFGEIHSYTTSDAYHAAVMGSEADAAIGATSNFVTQFNTSHTSAASVFSVQADHYIARLHTGVGTSTQVGKIVASGFHRVASGYPLTIGWLPQVNPADGAVYLSEILVTSTASENAIRGKLRGLRASLHAASGWSDGDTFSGSGELTGKTFEMMQTLSGGQTTFFALETSDTVEST